MIVVVQYATGERVEYAGVEHAYLHEAGILVTLVFKAYSKLIPVRSMKWWELHNEEGKK